MTIRRLCRTLLLWLLLPWPSHANDWVWSLPPDFPEPRVPADNPMSVAKVELGSLLFHDPRLSGNGTVSCASCHHADKAFSDGRRISAGASGEFTHRNSPGLFNLAWLATYTWANPALVSLERQMEVPLFGEDPVEMGITDANQAEILARFQGDTDYVRRFAKAFPDRAVPVSYETIIKAVAAFERGIISADSKYDRFRRGITNLNPTEMRGMELFFGNKAQCHTCHGGFNFNDQIVDAASHTVPSPFHDASIHGLSGFAFPNRGIFEFTGEANDMGKFRAPSLRNVALTAPYMHDGGMATLEEVLTSFGGTDGPQLTYLDKADIVAFLKTLTSNP